MVDECVNFHNKYVELLEEEKEQLVKLLENFFRVLKALDNPVLTKFYLNSLEHKKSWVYILATADLGIIDELRSETGMTLDGVS